MTRREALIVASMLGLTVAAVTGYLGFPRSPSYIPEDMRGDIGPLDIAWEVAVAWTYVATGLVAARKRPGNPVGPIMIAVGPALLLYGLLGLPFPLVVSFASWLSSGWPLAGMLIGALILVYPDGRIGSRLHRLWFGMAGVSLLMMLAASFVNPVPVGGCVQCRPLVVLSYSESVRNLVWTVMDVFDAVLAVMLAMLVVRRWMLATPAGRRTLLPVLVAGIVVAADVALPRLFWTSLQFMPWRSALLNFAPAMDAYFSPLGRAALIAFPLALLWGLLDARLGQTAVARLARELRAGDPARPSVRDAVRRALGDPSLEILLWSRAGQGWVDMEGNPGLLPETDARAVTRLDGEDGPLAALIHDPALNARQEMADAVASVAQLALENERLHAEVKAQLQEVRASRQRIVRAADEERRRVERNIHDGAQQRLVSLSLALGMAEAQAAASPAIASTLADATAELRAAITDLRELARGIHPAILTEAGLGPALTSLADHSPIPVAVHATLDSRLPPVVEATAYYIAAEALTNVAKHAAATAATLDATIADGTLRLVVSDDGRGGADPSKGSGLVGLLDRVAALGGKLTLEPGQGGGTCLRAEIPFA